MASLARRKRRRGPRWRARTLATLIALLWLASAARPPVRAEEASEGAASSPSQGSARQPLVLPLLFHVAERAGEPVADEAFLARQLRTANAVFASHGIAFRRAGRVPLPGRHAELVTRRDRDALAAYVKPEVADVFVVAKLMDVDEPGRERSGVHWRPRHAPEKRLVVLSAISIPDVLAHELGHFLGLRRHSTVPGNLMSYERGDAPLPFLSARQSRRVKAVAKNLLEKGLPE